MICRLSQKLNSKINAGALATAPLDDNPYADWSATILSALSRKTAQCARRPRLKAEPLITYG